MSAHSAPPEDPLLRASGIRKRFGATQAVRSADLDVFAGEVHAIMGENGSGKSTLVKIISGVHRPDSGDLRSSNGWDHRFRAPREAQARGIVAVFQEILVAENMSVLDNVWMGAERLLAAPTSRTERRRRASDALAEILDSVPDLDAEVGGLDLSTRQACAIARALLRDPRILILDEATSALDFPTRSRLFDALRRRRQAGVAVVLITHRMDEVEDIADRFTVMRSGSSVGTGSRADWDRDEVIRLMTGDARLVPDAVARQPRSTASEVVVDVDDIVLGPQAAAIRLEIRRGEVVGLAGLEGHGQDAFLRALWGMPAAGGRVVAAAPEGGVTLTSPRVASRAGVAYVPRERGRESGYAWMSILDNFAIPTIGRDVRMGWYSPGRSAARLAPFVRRLSIRLGRWSDGITTLSGGNQQKVMVARWLASAPAVLLLNDPTRGIDINAKRDLYRLFRELADEGLTVVMLSTELDEHLELMDRVLVFRENTVVADVDAADATRESLLAAFFGNSVSNSGGSS